MIRELGPGRSKRCRKRKTEIPKYRAMSISNRSNRDLPCRNRIDRTETCQVEIESMEPRPALDINDIWEERDSIHHHLLEGTFETATATELGEKLLYTNPSGWWWYRIGLPINYHFNVEMNNTIFGRLSLFRDFLRDSGRGATANPPTNAAPNRPSECRCFFHQVQ